MTSEKQNKKANSLLTEFREKPRRGRKPRIPASWIRGRADNYRNHERVRYLSRANVWMNPLPLGLPHPVTRSYPFTAEYVPDLPRVMSCKSVP